MCGEPHGTRRSAIVRMGTRTVELSEPAPAFPSLAWRCGSMSHGEVSVPPRLAAVAGPSTGATGWSSAAHGSSMTHEEVEFCAEEALVTIVPAFRKDAPLALLGGRYGPFVPQARAKRLSPARRLASRRARGPPDPHAVAHGLHACGVAACRRLCRGAGASARERPRAANFRRRALALTRPRPRACPHRCPPRCRCGWRWRWPRAPSASSSRRRGWSRLRWKKCCERSASRRLSSRRVPSSACAAAA